MNIVQITPGAGGMYCGNCFRDNALVAELRRQGHDVLMIPLYLPMTLDEADESAGTPLFFGGISVYLEQQIPFFGKAPSFVRQWLKHPKLLKWAAGRAAKTRAADVGPLTLSMLKGEEGRQSAELDELIAFLKQGAPPQVVALSNALLAGMARKIRQELKAPVVCMLQGEDDFLDALPAANRQACWETLIERAAEIDLFVAPSRYFGERMAARLKLRQEQWTVIHNGLALPGWTAPAPATPPVIGYFARMSREKGLDVFVDAFVELRKLPGAPAAKLKIGGAMGPSDEPLVTQMRQKLDAAGLAGDISWHPNVDKDAKQEFFQGLSLFSVPARYSESFGLYLLEAWAAGVPVVQPHHASFPELVQASRAGVITADTSPVTLAREWLALLNDPARRDELSRHARIAVESHFNLASMAQTMAGTFQGVVRRSVLGKEKEA